MAVGGRGGRGEGDPHLHPSAMKILPENRFVEIFLLLQFFMCNRTSPGGLSVTTHGSTDLQRFVVQNDAKICQIIFNSCHFAPKKRGGFGW